MIEVTVIQEFTYQDGIDEPVRYEETENGVLRFGWIKEYNEKGRVTKYEELNTNYVKNVEYDENDNKIKEYDNEGETKIYKYDDKKRITYTEYTKARKMIKELNPSKKLLVR